MSIRPYCTCVALVAAALALPASACNLSPDGMGGASFGSVGDSAAGDGSSEGDEGGDASNDAGEDAGDASASADGADAGDAGEGGESGGSDGGGSSSGAPPDDGGPPEEDLGDCSNFTSVDQFFSFVNNERSKYAGQFGNIPHSRYKGYPWQGEGHESFTFTPTFAWDDGLAAQAQADADALAAGANPQGNQQNGSNGLQLCAMAPFWIDGINTAGWKITVGESPEDWAPTMYPGSCPDFRFALLPDNQHARMGLHYHDFGGDGPAISKLGVGATLVPSNESGECKVWWVLQFGT